MRTAVRFSGSAKTVFGLALLTTIIPIAVAASNPVAGHNAVRKVILIGGYDACNNFPAPVARLIPQCENGGNRDFVHDRGFERARWQPIIDFLHWS